MQIVVINSRWFITVDYSNLQRKEISVCTSPDNKLLLLLDKVMDSSQTLYIVLGLSFYPLTFYLHIECQAKKEDPNVGLLEWQFYFGDPKTSSIVLHWENPENIFSFF